MLRASLRLIAFVSLIACTSSCKDLTHVQTGYISDRDDCYSRANYGVSTYTGSAGNISGKERSSMQSQLFCECMKDREWSVAGCKFKDVAKATAAPEKQQPTIVIVQQPAAPIAATAPAPEPLACQAPPGKKPRKRKLDGTCPAPAEYSQTELDNVLNKQ